MQFAARKNNDLLHLSNKQLRLSNFRSHGVKNRFLMQEIVIKMQKGRDLCKDSNVIILAWFGLPNEISGFEVKL